MPYSGKTTFAKYLSKNMGYPVVEGDVLDTMYALTIMKTPKARAEFLSLVKNYGEERAMGIIESRVTKLSAAKIVDLFGSNYGVITESVGFIQQSERTLLKDKVKERLDSIAELYWMETDLDTCLQRHREYQKGSRATQGLWLPSRPHEIRGRQDLTEDFVMKLWNRTQMPAKQEGFDKIFYVTAVSHGQYQIMEQPTRPSAG